jgi:hypothetical protein
VPITAGDPPTPLPSEVLASVDGGRGVAGFLIRPADLDRMALLVHGGPEHDGCEEQADALRAEVARLSGLLDEAGQRFEAMRERRNRARDHAVAAEQERDTARADLVRHRTERDAARAEAASLGQQLDACRAQQGRQAVTIAELRTRQPADAPTRLVVPETFLPTPEHPAALRAFAPGLVEYDGHELRVTYDEAHDGTLSTAVRVAPPAERPSDGYLDDAETWEPDPALGASPEVVALMRLDRLIGNEFSLSERGTGRARGLVLAALRTWHARQCEELPGEVWPGDAAAAGTVEGDPRRPHPDAWPDDAGLLRYRELRDLVALHLDRYADTRTARALRDGDVPLRLAEVLRP